MAIPGISRSISQDDLLRLLAGARAWLDSPPGQMLIETERGIMQQEIQRCFGQHLVQYGLAPELLDTDRSVLRNHWQLDLLAGREAIPAEETQWPFSPQSLDVVLLHHGLDFCLTPRVLLREASQAVRAGGYLLIFGFNPWSAWGIQHFTGREWFSEAGFVAPSRLVDWLELLGFSVEKRIDGCYRPPLTSQRWLDRLQDLEAFAGKHNLPGGGFYFLMARRQMLGVTPRRQRGRVFPALTLPPVVAGARRAQKRNKK